MSSPKYASGAERLRAHLETPNFLIVALGVYDGKSDALHDFRLTAIGQ